MKVICSWLLLKMSGFEVHYNNSSIVNFIPKADSVEKLKSIPCNFAIRGPGVRLSPHAFNTDEDIKKVLAVL